MVTTICMLSTSSVYDTQVNDENMETQMPLDEYFFYFLHTIYIVTPWTSCCPKSYQDANDALQLLHLALPQYQLIENLLHANVRLVLTYLQRYFAQRNLLHIDLHLVNVLLK